MRETHVVGDAKSLAETIAWLEARGFCAVAPAAMPGTPRAAIFFAKKSGACVQMVTLGDTLVWDGSELTIE
jgi:hypothetical protein